MTQSTKFQLFDFLVHTVWVCLKAITPYKAPKEKSTDKNHYNDQLQCSIYAMHTFSIRF